MTHVSGSRSDVHTSPSPSPRPTTPAGTGDAFFDSPELAASPAISPPRDPRRRPASPKEQRQRQDTRLDQATWAPAKGRPAPRLAAPPPYPAERFISPPKPPPPRPPAFTSPCKISPCIEMEVSYAVMAASPPTRPKPIPATCSPTANADAPTPRPRTTPPSVSPPASSVAGATDGTTATAADTNKPASRARAVQMESETNATGSLMAAANDPAAPRATRNKKRRQRRRRQVRSDVNPDLPPPASTIETAPSTSVTAPIMPARQETKRAPLSATGSKVKPPASEQATAYAVPIAEVVQILQEILAAVQEGRVKEIIPTILRALTKLLVQ
ncbi:unnamed protein product [Danaus chrysippus]|uniref:(African queen) hypothetical protein n=1 Tax=Danaus chrysippus TaxID=151541 RepID=A0A8J2RDE7_9NEOP|nr:unnamed protein product [Danaus chrysippus]